MTRFISYDKDEEETIRLKIQEHPDGRADVVAYGYRGCKTVACFETDGTLSIHSVFGALEGLRVGKDDRICLNFK